MIKDPSNPLAVDADGTQSICRIGTNQDNLQNYLPFEEQLFQKKKPNCPLFYGDLALLDEQFRVLEYRGPHIKKGERFALSDSERTFLLGNLSEQNRVVIVHNSNLLIVSGEFLSAGLFIAVRPPERTARVACALNLLATDEPILLSQAVMKLATRCDRETDFRDAESELHLLDAVLRPLPAHPITHAYLRTLSNYAGCAVRLTLEPNTVFPDTNSALSRMIAFLLCTLLSLRRQDPDGPQLSICTTQNGLTLELQGQLSPFAKESEPFAYLTRHPAFADVQADLSPNGRVTLRLTIQNRTDPAQPILK